MSVIKIIGIGSPFGADTVGRDVIGSLNAYLELNGINMNNVSLISLDRPGVGLLDYMQGERTVILIDAIKSGHEPGKVVRLDKNEIESLKRINSTHGFGVAETLSLGQALNSLPENIVLFGMEIGEDPEWMPLCEDIEALLELITREVDACIKEPALQC